MSWAMKSVGSPAAMNPSACGFEVSAMSVAAGRQLLHCRFPLRHAERLQLQHGWEISFGNASDLRQVIAQ
jgi:hypothetical protein